MSIIKTTPLTRSSEIVKFDDGIEKYRCYSKSNPHYYMNENNKLSQIEVEYKKDVTLDTVGNIQLADRNINSVGVRKDGNTSKFMAIRPDNNQKYGTEQLEFSIIDIELDNIKKSINLNDFTKTSDINTDLGDIIIRNNRHGVRQLIKSNDAINDFKIIYKLHLKNLKIQNEKQKYNNKIIRKKCSLTSDNKGRLDTFKNNIEIGALFDLNKETSSENLIRTCFHDANIFLMGTDCTHPELIPKDWSVWNNAINISTENLCTSLYLKNAFTIQIHKPSIYRRQLKSILCEFFENLTGNKFEFSTDVVNENSYPFVMYSKDSKESKIVGIWVVLQDTFCLTVTTEYSEDHNKLFEPGKQLCNSSINIKSYEDVIDKWDTIFVNKLYSDILKKGKEISIDGEYFEPDEEGNFVITNNQDEVLYKILTPKLIDDKYNVISENTIHTLKENIDGSFEYIKYPNDKCLVSDDIKLSSYIDADIFYGSTNDGYVENGADTWNGARNATTGTSFSSTSTSAGGPTRSQFYKGNYLISRSFFSFDTSAIEHKIISCAMKIHGATPITSSIPSATVVMKGTQGDTLSLDNFDSFTGNFTSILSSSSWSDTDYNSFVMNTDGIDAIDTTGTTYYCIRDYYDVVNATPGNVYCVGVYFADAAGTAADPYLEILIDRSYLSEGQKLTIFG